MAGRLGCEPGGIRALDCLIEEQRGALEYDFRTRFQLPLSAVGESMEYDEAWRLVQILRADPSSMLTSAMEGWAHPVSREALIMMDQYDLTHKAAGAKNPPRYPRPFKVDDREKVSRGNAAGRTPDQVKAILRTQFGQPETAA